MQLFLYKFFFKNLMKEINGKYMTKCWKYVILVNRKEQQSKKKRECYV